ncbi:MAG: putative circadian clock protein KaiC [Myxococcales bacterium]|nr:putative circadian clock protein KaiC [Myxococcales bacterium]
MIKPTITLETTGDAALDVVMGGGIPSQSVTVIAGEPGSGKTILTLQMLFAAARRGQKCLYFTTLSEPAIKVLRYMQSFDFFDVELLEKQIIFTDLASAIRKGGDATAAEIVSRVERHEPSLVAIDSFRAIGEFLRDPTLARTFVYDLATQMASWGATTLLVGEYARAEFSGFAEFAVADGIIRLGAQQQGLTSLRELELLKLRGANYVSGRHFFDIGRAGVRVYPRVRSPESLGAAPSLDDRISTGIGGLDELLDGGLPRSSSTVVQGGTGTGKTLIALSFLMAGVRAGQKGVLFTLEETPNQLRQIATGFGWDLAELEEQGLLAIRYTSPVELSTDRFLNDARNEVERMGAGRVVFDSLTTIGLGVPSERRFKELVYAISKHMRSLDASLLMTVESEQLLGQANLSGLGVSFVADNLIQLRYVELEGRLDRAISVIKARGVNLNSELRAATIGKAGMTVVRDRFKDLRGVLTGVPSNGRAAD